MYQFIYFALLFACSAAMAKTRDVGGGISPKAIFPICKTCSLPRAHFLLTSFMADFKFAAVGSDALCAQCAAEWLRTGLALLKVRRAGLMLDFIFYYFYAEMEINIIVAASVIYTNTLFLRKLHSCP